MPARTVGQANTQMPLLLPQTQRVRCARRARMRQQGAQAYKTVYVTLAFRDQMGARVHSVSVESIKLQQGQMPARTVG